MKNTDFEFADFGTLSLCVHERDRQRDREMREIREREGGKEGKKEIRLNRDSSGFGV